MSFLEILQEWIITWEITYFRPISKPAYFEQQNHAVPQKITLFQLCCLTIEPKEEKEEKEEERVATIESKEEERVATEPI